MRCQTAGALKFSEQIKQQQDAAERRLGRTELVQSKIVGGQILFEFGGAVLHISSAVVVAPNQLGRQREMGDEHAEGVAGHLEELSSQ